MIYGQKMATTDLHITKPNYTNPRIISPFKISIDASALLEVIETIYYDNSNTEESSNTRLIGTLLGTYSEDGNVVIKSAYIVPHSETEGELIFEESYHFSTYHLYKRGNSDLQVVGWFSTNSSFDLNTSLLQEFYSKNSPNHPQIYLTLSHRNENNEIVAPIVKTYLSSPVGLPASSTLAHSLGLEKEGTCAFVSIENEIVYSKNEITALKSINKAAGNEERVTDLTQETELKQLEAKLTGISAKIQNLSEYAKRAASGEIEGNQEVGQLLLSALKFQLSDSELAYYKEKLEQHSNEILLVEYLSSCIQQQLELSSKLTNFITPEEALR